MSRPGSGFRVQGTGIAAASPSSLRLPCSVGFTLIEVLLAVAILGVIVTAVYGSFATAERAVEQATEFRDGTDMARTLLARISADISNAYVSPGMPETFFFGMKREDQEQNRRYDGIFFTTLTNWRRPGTREMALWEVGYTFEDRADGTGRILVRKEKRELSKDVPPREGTIDTALTEKVAGLRFRYFENGAWRDEWDAKKQGRLPRAVEVILSFADGKVYGTQVEVRNP